MTQLISGTGLLVLSYSSNYRNASKTFCETLLEVFHVCGQRRGKLSTGCIFR